MINDDAQWVTFTDPHYFTQIMINFKINKISFILEVKNKPEEFASYIKFVNLLSNEETELAVKEKPAEILQKIKESAAKID